MLKCYHDAIADATRIAIRALKLRDDLTENKTSVDVSDTVTTAARYEAVMASIDELKNAVTEAKYTSDVKELVYAWLGLTPDAGEDF